MTIIEIAIMASFTLIGAVGAVVAGARGALVAIVSFPLGVSVTLSLALVQLALPLPSWPIVPFVLACGAAIAGAIWRHRALRASLTPLLVACLVTVGVTVLHRFVPLTTWTTDSTFYMEIGRLLVIDRLDMVEFGALEKRQLAVPVLHGIGMQLGAGDTLGAAGPLFLLGTVSMMAWILRQRLRAVAPWAAIVLPLIAGGAFATLHRTVFSTFYLNGHMFVACALLILVALLWLRSLHGASSPYGEAWMLIAVAFAPSLVVARPEGTLLVGMVIVGVLRDDPTAARLLGVVTGAATVVWNGILVGGTLEAGATPSSSAVLMAALGTVLVGVSVAVTRVPPTLLRRAPAVAEITLWAVLGGFILVEIDVFVRSMIATRANILFGEGGWGLSFAMIGALVVLVLVLFRAADDRMVRFVITAFVPLALLLAYLRDGAYRIGDGDSLNRMWLHVLPIAIVWVLQRAVLGEWRLMLRKSRSRSAVTSP